jgi:nitroreductase
VRTKLLLAAYSLGLASCPVGLARYVEKTAIVSSLHLDADEEVLLAVIIGYGRELPEQHHRIGDNVVFIGERRPWGGRADIKGRTGSSRRIAN